jgi:hypothetical protein
MTVKIEFIVNDHQKGKVDLSQLNSVEVRGATGVATYRVDPLQDTLVRIVVVGVPAKEKDEDADNVPVEQELGVLGTSEAIKAFNEAQKEAEKVAAEEQREADKTAKTEEKELPTPAGRK